jgi:hypothetical protein
MALELTTSYLQDSLSLFRHYKKLAEGAMAQVDDEQLFVVPGADIDQESNSIAVIVRHMAGNMRSRWTDFLTGALYVSHRPDCVAGQAPESFELAGADGAQGQFRAVQSEGSGGRTEPAIILCLLQPQFATARC